jgi:hypothetical protein
VTEPWPSDLETLDHAGLVVLVRELMVVNERLVAEVDRLRVEAGRNSGNSSKPPSRDSAAERKRQAEDRKTRSDAKAGGAGKRKGKQRGAKGFGPKLTPDPDVVVDHRPAQCSGAVPRLMIRVWCGHDVKSWICQNRSPS